MLCVARCVARRPSRMSQRPPARPGDPIDAIETPALVLDLDAFDANLQAMAGATRDPAVRLRPHAKSHKCPDIAKRQLALGAVGVCCQKTDEALAFIEAGVRDVLVTNEVVGPTKLARLAAAAAVARIGVLADTELGVRLAAEAAAQAGTSLDLYVEVDVGAHRCGVAPEAAAPLAQSIAAHASLRFAGLHCYHGGAQHLRSDAEREAAIAAAGAVARRARDDVRARGLDCPVVTGAGTGTFVHERDSGVWNELQPGSYVFMDADYGRNVPGGRDVRFAQALFVLASVMSVPAADRAICDAGLKAFSLDSGLPVVHERAGLQYTKASDEHGVLGVDRDARRVDLGERLLIVPGHCDPTVNLYDWIVGLRHARVECVWPIAARGALA